MPGTTRAIKATATVAKITSEPTNSKGNSDTNNNTEKIEETAIVVAGEGDAIID